MKKALSIAFLATGIILLVFGLNAWQSIGSDMSRFFTGSPTDKTLWLLIGGLSAGLIGLFGLLRH